MIRFQVTNQTKIQQEIYKHLLLQKKNNETKSFPQDFEFQTFSQNGEDGILQEIFKRLDIRTGDFIEIGTGDGSENNTRLLLEIGWKGTWIDGDKNSCSIAENSLFSFISKGFLKIKHSYVSPANINSLLKELNLDPNMDLLSLDLDLTTHLVWENLNYIRPKVCIIEYNGFFNDEIVWKADTTNSKVWDGSINMGASLTKLVEISLKKNYFFVGCDITGTNAFFVRKDFSDKFLIDKFSASYESAKPFLVNNAVHRRI